MIKKSGSHSHSYGLVVVPSLVACLVLLVGWNSYLRPIDSHLIADDAGRSPRLPTLECGTRALDVAAGLVGADRGYSRTACADGSALANGQRGARSFVGLFKQEGPKWTEQATSDRIGSQVLVDANFLENAPQSDGVPLGVLERLGTELGPPARAGVAAAQIVSQLHTAAVRLDGAYVHSSVAAHHGQLWLATVQPRVVTIVSADPWKATVDIYRWSGRAWATVGVVRADVGLQGGGIGAASLTGSLDPDFVITSGGASGDNWFAVVSDVGGTWHAVPFDYGYAPTTVTNVYAEKGGLLETAVDACGCAGGPTSTLWERYAHGIFEPTNPPGMHTACTTTSIDELAQPDGDPQVAFDRVACDDGWAIAVGTGSGFSYRVVDLFEQRGTGGSYQAGALDNGAGLGRDPGIYDIPLSLLDRLAAEVGLGDDPAVKSGALVAALQASHPDIESPATVSGVMTFNSSDWIVAEVGEGPPSPEGLFSVTAMIYRWAGGSWKEQGRVVHVGTALDMIYSGGWFTPVPAPGTTEPAFVQAAGMFGKAPVSTIALTDVGGRWHTARITVPSGSP